MKVAEISLSIDEIPLVLNELNDSAMNYIKQENYEKGLILLQKAHGIIDVTPQKFNFIGSKS
jgi:hypothetical protein